VIVAMPNKLPAVDAAITILLHVALPWRGTTVADRYADRKCQYRDSRQKNCSDPNVIPAGVDINPVFQQS
jgi:hypothetical protein